MNILHVKSIEVGKISAHPHPTLCVQFLNRENNDKNNTQILCVRRSFWRFLPFLLVLPSLLFCYKTKMSNNTTTTPIFFSSFLSLWPKYPLPPVTRIFLPWSIPTYSYSDKRACIRPAATYLGYGLQNQMCGVIVISYNLIGVSSSFRRCHMIVN